MICPSPARLAAAASGQDPAALAHSSGCIACAAAIARDRETRALLAGVPDVDLAAGRRARLRAELLAASDAARGRPQRPPRARWVVAGLAMAAGIALLVAVRGLPDSPPLAPASGEPQLQARVAAAADAGLAPDPRLGVSPDAAPAVADQRVAAAPGAGAPPDEPVAVADVVAAGAYQRNGDRVQLADGAALVDARGRRAAEVVVRGARVSVDGARVRVTARAGRLVQVQVFAGSAQVNLAGRVHRIEVGQVWVPPAGRQEPPAAPPRSPASQPLDPPRAPSPSEAAPAKRPAPQPSPALVAFRTGWEALRAGRHAEAVAAFDRATDPIVAEDATYWAAVAAARAGDQRDAQRRLRAFLAAYPRSPHADDARAALSP